YTPSAKMYLIDFSPCAAKTSARLFSLKFTAAAAFLQPPSDFILLYHQLTRTHTVLPGRNTPMLLQSPWQYTKYYLRAFHCLNAFLLRQNCLHLTVMDFCVIFGF
uniref:hypothetical protein n=1 Tax=Candidatus Limivicinus sp. TaxID=3030905 RepID=UPI003FF0C9AF